MFEFLGQILLIIKIISGIVSVIMFGLVIYLMRATGYFDSLKKLKGYKEISKDTIKSENKVTKEWESIKARLALKSEAHNKLAVIEADKLVDNVLKKMGYIGNSMGDRLKQLSDTQLTNLSALWTAHKLRNNIVHTSNFHITEAQAAETIQMYEQVLKELEAL